MAYEGPVCLPAERSEAGVNDTADVDNRYKYNGKEYQAEHGLNWSAYGARYYDPVVGRFTGVDPLADKYFYVTPYNYAENEPIANIDLWGLQKYRFNNEGVIDQKGIIKDVPDDQADKSVSAAITRVTFQVLDFLGINALDNAIANLGNSQESFTDKTLDVVSASMNVVVMGGKPGAKVTNGPDYVVTPAGESIKIPKGAIGPTNPEKGSGMVYQGGSGGNGMNERTTGVRIMDANSNQGRRVSYMNNRGQTVDPVSGRTISNKDPRGHIPLKEY